MYKPRTVAQFKVMEFLKASFELEEFLIAPLSLNGLMLEDRTGVRIAFVCHNDTILESAIPAPAGRKEVLLFAERLRMAYPRPEEQTFEAKTKLWLDAPGLVTFQQALGLKDDLFRHYLKYTVHSEDVIRSLVASGMVTEEEFHSILLWYLNGNWDGNRLCVSGVDSAGVCVELVLKVHQPDQELFQFYLEGDEETLYEWCGRVMGQNDYDCAG